MNEKPEPNQEPLRTILRGARPNPPLPPRFQDSVWRRIETVRKPAGSALMSGWLDRAAAWLLRPRLALGGLVAMLLLGTVIGATQGSSLANALAKEQYLAAVSPLATR